MARIGQPVRRALPVRLLLMLGLCFLYTWRKLRLPKNIWGRQIRGILHNWSDEMFHVLLKSRVTRAYPDIPCALKMPPDWKPKAEVDEQFRLSEKEIEFFWTNGYLPPFQAFTTEEIEALGEEIKVKRHAKSEAYGKVTERDRHLDLPRMMEFMKRPAIIERCAQIMGPDLLCWRSQFFYKEARGPAVQWHQASCLLFEDTFEPVLRPPDRDELFQLTVWVAVDPSYEANGCLRFLPGTADHIRTLTFGGKDGFYEFSRYTIDGMNEDDQVLVEAKPGQVILFCERTLHGSAANTTDNTRSAFNYRLVRPETRVYQDKTYHRAHQIDQRYSLKNWGCVLMRGEDNVGRNKLVEGAPETAVT